MISSMSDAFSANGKTFLSPAAMPA